MTPAGYQKQTASAAYLEVSAIKHSEEFLALVNEVLPNVREIDVKRAIARIDDGAVLIDVREDREWEEGHAADAVHMGRGIIERDIVGVYPDKDTELILYCGGGFRSALATENLQKMGYTNVYSMTGGWKAWKEAELPVV